MKEAPDEDRTRWQLLKSILGDAMEIEDPVEREHFVQKACAGDEDLLTQARRILAIHDESGLALDRAPVGVVPLGNLMAETLSEDRMIAGRFRIVRRLGSGGMGEVYEALDTALGGTRLALKTIRPEHAGQPAYIGRFKQELQLLRQITHANVCRVFDFFPAEPPAERAGEPAFFTMELVEGETLSARLDREGPLTPEAAAMVFGQILQGLDAAHAAGVIHRDLKPSNIMLAPSSRVVLMDFGIAYGSHAGSTGGTSLTQGAIVGTPLYMSPEQLQGLPVSPATDVYAFGVVAYQALTGSVPFGGSSPMAIMARKLSMSPTTIVETATGIPPNCRRVIERCLAHDPAERYSSAAEVREALGKGHHFRWKRPGKNSGLGWWIAAAAVAALLAGSWWVLRQSNPDPPPAAGQFYREGLAALQEGSLSTASRALSDVVRRVPDWPLGHARLAQVYDELDQPDRARLEILRAIQHKPAFGLPAIVIEAIQALVSKDYAGAEKSFRQALSRTSGAARADALLDLAKCLERAEKPRPAATVLDQLLVEDPSHSSANLLRAQLAIRLRADPTAIQRLFDAANNGYRTLNRFEGLAQTEYQLANWHFERQNLPAAGQALDDSLRYAEAAGSPWIQTRALFMKGRVAQSALQEDEARNAANRALEIGRQNRFGETLAQGFLDLGILSFAHGKVKEALQLYETAEIEAVKCECWRTKARIGDRIANALTSLGQFEDAEKRLAESQNYFAANGLEADSLRCALRLSLIRQRQGRRPEAKELMLGAYAGAVRIGNEEMRLTAALRLANLAVSQGEFPEVLQRFQEFTRISRENGFREDEFTGRLTTGDAYQQLGDFALARAEFDALANDPRFASRLNRLQVQYQRALLDTEEGHHDRALASYRAMIAEASQEQLASFLRNVTMGQCGALIAAGRPGEARAACGPTFLDPQAEVSRSGYQQADLHLLENRLIDARLWAEGAREANVKIGNRDNAFYSLLIRGQAERRAHDPRLAATVAEADRLFQDFSQRWGDSVAKTYLHRPLYQSRWDEIHQPNSH